MVSPWFNANAYAWIPGTVFGVIAGMTGSLAGSLAPRGKGRSLVLGLMILETIASLAMLLTGIIALVCHQPYGVWYGFLLPGVLGVIIIPSLMVGVRRAYAEAELRKSRAQDL